MKSYIAAFFIIGIVGSLLIAAFSDQIKAAVLDALVKVTSENAVRPAPAPEPPPADARPSWPAGGTEWVPPGFKGPATAPRIIGPKSNPPDY